MEIAKSEIFGPVLSIIPFDSEEEAIKIVNDTEYGLGNYIQTSDMEKARRVAKNFVLVLSISMVNQWTLEHHLEATDNRAMVEKVANGA